MSSHKTDRASSNSDNLSIIQPAYDENNKIPNEAERKCTKLQRKCNRFHVSSHQNIISSLSVQIPANTKKTVNYPCKEELYSENSEFQSESTYFLSGLKFEEPLSGDEWLPCE